MGEKNSCSGDLEDGGWGKAWSVSDTPTSPYPGNLLLHDPQERRFALLVETQPENQPLTLCGRKSLQEGEREGSDGATKGSGPQL